MTENAIAPVPLGEERMPTVQRMREILEDADESIMYNLINEIHFNKAYIENINYLVDEVGDDKTAVVFIDGVYQEIPQKAAAWKVLKSKLEMIEATYKGLVGDSDKQQRIAHVIEVFRSIVRKGEDTCSRYFA